MLARLEEMIVARAGNGPVLNRKLQLAGARRYPGLLRHEFRETRRPRLPADVITIIPTIGRRSLVPAVESALAQLVDDHLVVVVSDGPQRLPPLPSSVAVIETRAQCGVVGVVRNIAIRSTQSPFIAFLDDDNTWRPDHLHSCLTAITKNGADVVYSSVLRFRPDGSHCDTIGEPWSHDRVRWVNYVDASAIVARRFSGLRFSRAPRVPTPPFSEDWEFVWRVSRRRRVAWTGAATINYSLSPEQVAFLDGLRPSPR
jgi:hypothetical protein